MGRLDELKAKRKEKKEARKAAKLVPDRNNYIRKVKWTDMDSNEVLVVRYPFPIIPFHKENGKIVFGFTNYWFKKGGMVRFTIFPGARAKIIDVSSQPVNVGSGNACKVICADGIQVTIDTAFTYSISDPRKYTLASTDPLAVLKTRISEVLGKAANERTYKELQGFSIIIRDSKDLFSKIEKELGIKVTKLTVESVELDPNLQGILEKLAMQPAENQRRILEAETGLQVAGYEAQARAVKAEGELSILNNAAQRLGGYGSQAFMAYAAGLSGGHVILAPSNPILAPLIGQNMSAQAMVENSAVAPQVPQEPIENSQNVSSGIPGGNNIYQAPPDSYTVSPYIQSLVGDLTIDGERQEGPVKRHRRTGAQK